MRNRPVEAALMVVALVGLGVVTAPGAAAVPDPFEPALAASPSSTTVPATIQVTGSCPALGEDSETGWVYPSSAGLTFPAAGVTSTTVDLDSGGEFTGTFTLPSTLAPAEYGLTLFCDNSEVGASVTVVPPEVPATLNLDPDSGQVGDSVQATGACPLAYERVEIFFDDVAVTTATPDSSTGAFGPVDVVVPDVDRGAHDVTTSCQAFASFEVLPPDVEMTLSIQPSSGVVGDDVTATGTCPVVSDGARLAFGEEDLGSTEVDPETGAFGPVVFPVPDVAAGSVTVRLDCGLEESTTQTFTVLPPTVPGSATTPGSTTAPGSMPAPGSTTAGPGTTAGPEGTTAGPGAPGSSREEPLPTPTVVPTPEGPMIRVPDLRGLTEDQVIASLGDLLVLANPTGEDGRVRRQSPPPGTLVQPASEVSVVLDGPPPPSRLPLLLLALFVAAVVAGLVAADHLRRRRIREERWLDEQVRAELQPQKAVPSVVPDHAVPGIDIRLEVHRSPARL
jgi:hypothetical protein